MIVVDTTRRNPARAAWRSWRRRLQGVLTRTLASAAPLETWTQAVPTLNAAAEAAMRAQLEHEYHARGRSMPAGAYEALRDERAKVQPIVAVTMGPQRCVEILCYAGVDFPRALRLLEVVGAAVSEVIAFADVIDVVLLDDESRGAA